MNLFNTKGILLVFLYLASCTQKSTKNQETELIDQPNIILIMADDLGYGDLSGYGHPTIKTPFLDQMAAEGMRFTDFHSNGAVCSPTRAALMTGKYQQRVGIEGVVTAKSHREVGLALDEVTIADALKKQGYFTGMMGKWHLGYPERYNPVHHGFDEFIGYVSGNVDYHSHVDQEAHEDWWHQNKLQPEEGYSTDLITKHSVSFINKHKDENFFLYIPHESPHGPIQGRKSEPFRVIGTKINNNPEKNLEAVYKEMIEVMDEGIGEVLNTVKSLGIDQKTLVIFCSDNGPASLGSSGGLHGKKGSIWEGGHRVPAIAWWPGTIDAGQESNQPVMTMDLFPTIMAITNADQKEVWDGVDISNVLLKNDTLPKRDLFWRHFSNDGSRESTAVRSGDWKLVRLPESDRPQLYNLKQDLAETNDLADDHPEIVEELTAKFTKWESEVTEGVEKVSP